MACVDCLTYSESFSFTVCTDRFNEDPSSQLNLNLLVLLCGHAGFDPPRLMTSRVCCGVWIEYARGLVRLRSPLARQASADGRYGHALTKKINSVPLGGPESSFLGDFCFHVSCHLISYILMLLDCNFTYVLIINDEF